MITHQRQLPCRTPRGTGPPEGPVTSRLEPRTPLAMPNDNDDMSARADRSAVGPRGPIDTHLLYPSTETLSVHTFLLESHRDEPLRRYREDLLDSHTADVIARLRPAAPRSHRRCRRRPARSSSLVRLGPPPADIGAEHRLWTRPT